MHSFVKYCFLVICFSAVSTAAMAGPVLTFNFYGDTISLILQDFDRVDFDNRILSQQAVVDFYDALMEEPFENVLEPLLLYRQENELNDWVYYQLIRKTAEQISPKAANYERYTLYKWFLLSKSGFDAKLVLLDNKMLFYVRSNDNVYNLPVFRANGLQYVCLNHHDYGYLPIRGEVNGTYSIGIPEGVNAFSYKVNQLPDFTLAKAETRHLEFKYRDKKSYYFKIELNPEVEMLFRNYPVVDFESYLNIPLSRRTYSSLIPMLRDILKDKSETEGIDYLMEFTRNAFLYEDDRDNFGREKRMGPEQTLFQKYSDCDDRVALFFCLVKEIYNRPMLVLLYPTHVSIAVNFSETMPNEIKYGNLGFAVCEPTPQEENLEIGELPHKFRKHSFEIAYVYDPMGNLHSYEPD